jgi:hypothetical protein
MRTWPRIIIAVVVGLVAAFETLDFTYTAAGGFPFIRVVDHWAVSAGWWMAGGGVFLSAVAVMMWRTGIRKATDSGGKARLSLGVAVVLRLIVVQVLLVGPWSMAGGRFVRSQVRVFIMDGDPELIRAKWMEAEKAKLPFRVWWRPVEDSLLVVKKEHAESVRKEVEAGGISLREWAH